MMARKSTAEQRAEYVARQRSFDPEITVKNYTRDLIIYQNYHNANTETKVLRKWAVQYAIKLAGSTVANIVERASDFELRSIGIVGRAIMNEHPISIEHVYRIDEQVRGLFEKYKVKKTAETKKVESVAVKSADTRNLQLLSKHLAEVDAAIDDFATQAKDFSMKGYLASANVPAAVAKQIGQRYVRLEKELRETLAGKDSQLNEAYLFMGKVRLRRLHALVQQIIVDCAQQVVTAKVRVPRAKKEKPASVLAAKMKYLKQFDELKLVSEKPEKIIGSDTVWVYDTERRRLAVYVAEAGQKLSIRGTTITGFSVKDSGIKTLRKPELTLTGSFAKRTIMKTFEDLSTKAQTPNGRTNEKSIIVKVF
jgi:hypothetical protein